MSKKESKKAAAAKPAAVIDEESLVVRFLHEHPDFFEHHPELLVDLHIPHESGAAVSLVERQVGQMRTEIARCRKQLAEFISVAKENEALSLRMHRLTLQLMESQTQEQAIEALREILVQDFKADVTALLWLDDPGLEAHRDSPEASGSSSALWEIVDRGRPVCGNLGASQLGLLFGDGAGSAESAAVVPIRVGAVAGLLAIGSASPDRFHPTKGTEVLGRLGEIVSRSLQALSSRREKLDVEGAILGEPGRAGA